MNDSQWLSTSDAAALLGVSEKTVWRRARRGELTARKVTGARGALVWEIALDGTGQTDRTNGQSQAANQPDNRPQSPVFERESSDQSNWTTGQDESGQPAKPTGQSKSANASTEARFMAHLEAENKFLREALEQRDRDAAELRAALRAALKLTGATTAPQLTAGNAPESAQTTLLNTKAVNHSPEPMSEPQRGTSTREAELTYADIADELERRLNK